ncbi:hypothetical protein FGO68_gene5653 [Halteria grandinella]|uniref:Uncharacterized protein n=1 Tax=Halteria grandinella TaxID=5974 RepID=A0A8J8T8B3_HALGN|nr:hypothetical protein FGO68_gene5653 [Halteria grandinella]
MQDSGLYFSKQKQDDNESMAVIGSLGSAGLEMMLGRGSFQQTGSPNFPIQFDQYQHGFYDGASNGSFILPPLANGQRENFSEQQHHQVQDTGQQSIELKGSEQAKFQNIIISYKLISAEEGHLLKDQCASPILMISRQGIHGILLQYLK